jgi:plastocyanin
MKKRMITVGGLILLAALLAAVATAVSNRPPAQAPIHIPDSPEPVISQTKPFSIQEQMAGLTGVQKVRITDSGFEPKELQTAVGGKVRIHLVNESSGEHNLIINRFGIVTRTLAPGEENFVEFTADAKGNWLFLSDAPGAVEPAFGGTLKVE